MSWYLIIGAIGLTSVIYLLTGIMIILSYRKSVLCSLSVCTHGRMPLVLASEFLLPFRLSPTGAITRCCGFRSSCLLSGHFSHSYLCSSQVRSICSILKFRTDIFSVLKNTHTRAHAMLFFQLPPISPVQRSSFQ